VAQGESPEFKPQRERERERERAGHLGLMPVTPSLSGNLKPTQGNTS
jgi:hypothetical protein